MHNTSFPCVQRFFTSYIQYILIFCKCYILTILFSVRRTFQKCPQAVRGTVLCFENLTVKNKLEVMLAGQVVVTEAVNLRSWLLFVPVLTASSCRVHVRVRDVGDGETGHVGGGDGEAGEPDGWFGVRSFGDGAGGWRGVRRH